MIIEDWKARQQLPGTHAAQPYLCFALPDFAQKSLTLGSACTFKEFEPANITRSGFIDTAPSARC
jgi:hypothetical protein